MVKIKLNLEMKVMMLMLILKVECFLDAIGMARSMIALTSSSLVQPMMASAVHSILLPWKSSCKILCKE